MLRLLNRLILIVAIGGGFPTRPALAQTPSLETQVQQLAAEIAELRRENHQLRTDFGLAAHPNQPVVKSAGRETLFALGGLLQMQADGLDQGDSRFTSDHDRVYLRRARLNASGQFREGVDFRIELELGGLLSETTAMRAQLTDSYLNWNRYEFANLRLGQFKTPYGYEQLFLDPRLFTIERSLPNDRLTLGRQIGAQAGGDLFSKRLSYAVGGFNGTGTNTSGNDNDAFLWVGRISGVAWQGKLAGQAVRWTAGINAFSSRDTALANQPAEFGLDSTPNTAAPDNIFTGRRTGQGVDTQVKIGSFELWTEYLQTRFEQSGNRTVTAAGWYAQGTYFAVPDILQTVLKFEHFDPNDAQPDNTTNTWTVGVNYLFKADDLKFQLNYLVSDLPHGLPSQDKLIFRVQTIF